MLYLILFLKTSWNLCATPKRICFLLLFLLSEWVEFTPYEVGMDKYGTFMKTELFGSQFFCGKLVKQYPEPPLFYLQGLSFLSGFPFFCRPELLKYLMYFFSRVFRNLFIGFCLFVPLPCPIRLCLRVSVSSTVWLSNFLSALKMLSSF